MLSTSDGGINWQRQAMNGVIVRGFHFINSLEGWAAGVMGGDNRYGVLLKTEDGGATWKRSFFNSNADDSWGFTDVWPITGDNIWAVGTITVHSTDRGNTWKRIELPEGFYGVPSIVRFADADIGWILTNQGDKFLFTTDGGARWSIRVAPSETDGFTDLVYVSASEAWGLSNGLYHTTDGGETWKRIGQDKVCAIQYLRDQNRLFAVNAAGLMYDSRK